MIGRADIEGSKNNVAMNAWLPQASHLLSIASAMPTAAYIQLASPSPDSRATKYP
ncbi:hypothetical protein K457DRAFT_893729 [Linnemannia elongata AG-77]|uniref:Uncharacterized protein n=1 Tax=Linnemannia elongata AG-77 TaxID=1314771 RepID=A0A197JX92_9FUNG|nr:hypothetical protein K457DRAFT_893729 [Linnemannia elongata AG-77]